MFFKLINGKYIATTAIGAAAGYELSVIKQRQQDSKNTENPKINNQITQQQVSKFMQDWRRCRDNCYNERTRCFNRGGTNCDTNYDTCTRGCDSTHGVDLKP